MVVDDGSVPSLTEINICDRDRDVTIVPSQQRFRGEDGLSISPSHMFRETVGAEVDRP